MIISIFPIKNTTFSLIGLLRNVPITVLFKVLNTKTEIKKYTYEILKNLPIHSIRYPVQIMERIRSVYFLNVFFNCRYNTTKPTRIAVISNIQPTLSIKG